MDNLPDRCPASWARRVANVDDHGPAFEEKGFSSGYRCALDSEKSLFDRRILLDEQALDLIVYELQVKSTRRAA